MKIFEFNLWKKPVLVGITLGVGLIFFALPVLADSTYTTLYNAVHDTGTRTYTLEADEGLTQDLGTMEGTELSIYGNNFTIDGDGHAGVTISNAQIFNTEGGTWSKLVKLGREGGVIRNEGGIVNINNTKLLNNTADIGGAIRNRSGYLNILNSTLSENNTNNAGGAISNIGIVNIIDTNFLNNIATAEYAGAISSIGTVNIIAQNRNILFSGNKAGNSNVDIKNYEAGVLSLCAVNSHSITLNGKIVGSAITKIGATSGNYTGVVNFNNDVTQGQMNIYSGVVNATGATFNITNGIVNNATLNLNNVTLNGAISGTGGVNILSDVVANADITGNNVTLTGGTLTLNNGSFDGVGTLTANGGALSTQNGAIANQTMTNLVFNTDLHYSFDIDPRVGGADRLNLAGTLTDNGNKIVVDDVNLVAGMSHGRTVTLNLTDSTAVAGTMTTPTGLSWKDVINGGSGYKGLSANFDPATGNLVLVNFDLSTGTIDQMTARSEAYLDSSHSVITLSATGTGYNSSVKIDGTTYYFNTDNENLKTLVTSGSNALKETTSGDSTAVFTYGGKYYTYDYDKLPISAYETSVVENPESGADYNYSTTDSEGNKTYYNIDIPTYRLGKSDNIDWEIVDPSEAIADTETGKLKSGYIVIKLTKSNGSPDYRYYKYVYVGRRNNNSSLGASIKALRNGSADENGTESTSDGKETASQTYKRVMQEQQMEFVRAVAYGSKNNPKPCVLSAPITAQVGGYLTQVNSYDQAFANLDMEMMNSSLERALGQEGTKALGNGSADDININKNKSHAKQSNSGSLNALLPYCLSAFSKNSREGLSESNSDNGINRDGKGLWNRAYATFERVHLTSGPTVGNIAYGNFFGGDMGKKELRNGWKRQFSAYIGYNGSTQDFDRQSIDQNGGTLGVMETWYKGNFFTALTANVSGNFADANTDIGKERMAMLMAGVASKTGYNFEFVKGKFIIQPSILLSYSFVHTFAHNNGLGSRVHSSPLNAIQVAPGIKFIANLKNGWQPYLGVNMRWNIIDKTSFNLREVNIPDMSIHPYIEYGVGLQKRWGDRFTGYFQTMLRNGARNGVMLSVGLRWAIGK